MRVRARLPETSARLRFVMCKRSFTPFSVSTHDYNQGRERAFLLVPRWLHFPGSRSQAARLVPDARRTNALPGGWDEGAPPDGRSLQER